VREDVAVDTVVLQTALELINQLRDAARMVGLVHFVADVNHDRYRTMHGPAQNFLARRAARQKARRNDPDCK
jgi:hypothetical protein